MQIPKSALSDELDRGRRDRLEMRSEIDQLQVEVEALKSALRRALPDFGATYERAYAEALQSFDPESPRARLKKSA